MRKGSGNGKGTGKNGGKVEMVVGYFLKKFERVITHSFVFPTNQTTPQTNKQHHIQQTNKHHKQTNKTTQHADTKGEEIDSLFFRQKELKNNTHTHTTQPTESKKTTLQLTTHTAYDGKKGRNRWKTHRKREREEGANLFEHCG